jgi:hypothetical protein
MEHAARVRDLDLVRIITAQAQRRIVQLERALGDGHEPRIAAHGVAHQARALVRAGAVEVRRRASLMAARERCLAIAAHALRPRQPLLEPGRFIAGPRFIRLIQTNV